MPKVAAPAPTPPPVAPRADDDDDDDDEYDDDADSGAGDSVGSLEDFIVDDEGEEGESDDGASVASEPPATREEALARDLDGISSDNIVLGKRTRRPTQFYEHEVFGTSEYRRMLLEDVPPDELHAVEGSDSDATASDSDDDEYVDDEEDEDDAPEP
jgi:hypothetical protein